MTLINLPLLQGNTPTNQSYKHTHIHTEWCVVTVQRFSIYLRWSELWYLTLDRRLGNSSSVTNWLLLMESLCSDKQAWGRFQLRSLSQSVTFRLWIESVSEQSEQAAVSPSVWCRSVQHMTSFWLKAEWGNYIISDSVAYFSLLSVWACVQIRFLDKKRRCQSSCLWSLAAGSKISSRKGFDFSFAEIF